MDLSFPICKMQFSIFCFVLFFYIGFPELLQIAHKCQRRIIKLLDREVKLEFTWIDNKVSPHDFSGVVDVDTSVGHDG